MNKFLLCFLLFISFWACKNIPEDHKNRTIADTVTLKYAKSFSIEKKENYTLLNILSAWPGANQTYRYALAKKGVTVPDAKNVDAVIEIPLKSIVVTSTTHIPSLEMLKVDSLLVGFPSTQYISSKKTRKRIDDGQIKDLGVNEDLNTELLITLDPDAIITFAVEGENKTLALIEKIGIPSLYNADWTEEHPLGKAEWIKFFGLLFDKEEEANSIFNTIEKNYLEVKKIAQNKNNKPTIISGALYKDIWYAPQGNSWVAQLIKDAHGDYVWANTEGTGSLALQLESVLEKGKDAQFWIGPGQYTSKNAIKEAHPMYEQLEAFKNNNVFTFTKNKGATGGVVYYELAPNRPDLVLQDIIKIIHPELLQDRPFSFFDPID